MSNQLDYSGSALKQKEANFLSILEGCSLPYQELHLILDQQLVKRVQIKTAASAKEANDEQEQKEGPLAKQYKEFLEQANLLSLSSKEAGSSTYHHNIMMDDIKRKFRSIGLLTSQVLQEMKEDIIAVARKQEKESEYLIKRNESFLEQVKRTQPLKHALLKEYSQLQDSLAEQLLKVDFNSNQQLISFKNQVKRAVQKVEIQQFSQTSRQEYGTMREMKAAMKEIERTMQSLGSDKTADLAPTEISTLWSPLFKIKQRVQGLLSTKIETKGFKIPSAETIQKKVYTLFSELLNINQRKLSPSPRRSPARLQVPNKTRTPRPTSPQRKEDQYMFQPQKDSTALHIYNISKKKFETRQIDQNFPISKAITHIGNQCYIAGGVESGLYSDQLLRINRFGITSILRPMAVGKAGFPITADDKGQRLFTIGGFNNNCNPKYFKAAHTYIIGVDKWAALPNYPHPLSGSSACVLQNEQLYNFGGNLSKWSVGALNLSNPVQWIQISLSQGFDFTCWGFLECVTIGKQIIFFGSNQLETTYVLEDVGFDHLEIVATHPSIEYRTGGDVSHRIVGTQLYAFPLNKYEEVYVFNHDGWTLHGRA